MDLTTLTKAYKDFLKECSQKGWVIEVLVEEFGNYLTSIQNNEGVEVHFFMELDLENRVQLSDKTNQCKLEYGVIRQKEKGDVFAKEVLEAFHQYLAKHYPKRSFIIFKR